MFTKECNILLYSQPTVKNKILNLLVNLVWFAPLLMHQKIGIKQLQFWRKIPNFSSF